MGQRAIALRCEIAPEGKDFPLQGHLKELIEKFAQPGALTWIGLRPARLAFVQEVDSATISAAGLEGDHGASQGRAVTLLQAEHLAVIGSMLGRGSVAPSALRRNLVVEGLNLAALRGRSVQVGSTLLEITGPCAPCSRMEQALGTGGYSAMRGHGGWCARVLVPGDIRVGDAIVPLTSDAIHLSKTAQ